MHTIYIKEDYKATLTQRFSHSYLQGKWEFCVQYLRLDRIKDSVVESYNSENERVLSLLQNNTVGVHIDLAPEIHYAAMFNLDTFVKLPNPPVLPFFPTWYPATNKEREFFTIKFVDLASGTPLKLPVTTEIMIQLALRKV